MAEKLVHVPGDVFAGITEWQLERAASMLEELAGGIWAIMVPGSEQEADMRAEVIAFEWVAEALRKVGAVVEEGES